MTLKLGTEIPGTSAEGNITTIWVPAIKNIKAPTIIELEAGTDISNYVMLGGWSFDPSQDTVSDQRENTVQDFGAPGARAPATSASRSSTTRTRSTRNRTRPSPSCTRRVRLYRASPRHGHRRAIGLRPEAHRREREVRRKEGHQPDANTMIRSQIPLFAQAPGWESETAVLAAA